MIGYRAFWLAAARDFWVTTGDVNTLGCSERFLGSQIEVRIRYDILPGNVRLEVGYAVLFAGDIIEDVTDGGDGSYVYTQVLLDF